MKTSTRVGFHFAFGFCAAVSSLAAPPANVLMPAPAVAAWSEARLPVTAAFTAALRGPDGHRVREALGRALRLWEERSGLTFGRAPNAEFAPPATDASPTLRIECSAAAAAIPALG